MVTSPSVLKKIKEIIEKHYNKLALNLLGNAVFSKEELDKLKEQGIDVSNTHSFLEQIYHHNFINKVGEVQSPTSVEDMKAQQSEEAILPKGEAHDFTIMNQNEKTKQYLDKMKMEINTRVQGVIRDNNEKFKNNALQNLDREDLVDDLIKESSLGKVKQKIRDLSGLGHRNFSTVASTEISNTIGIASVDRIVVNNQDKDLNEVYVYRISIQDAKLCKWCKEFYVDSDGSPKVYKLSTLLDNGSNYGKKPHEWLPVIGATHPMERCSQMIELKPGFKVLPGGNMTFIGSSEWADYIFEKVKS